MPRRAKSDLPFDCIALLLQGGGSLGAYQAGVYEALAEADLAPDWVAGISIGAINAAIIAGNPPQTRVERLREFWTQVTDTSLSAVAAPWFGDGQPLAGVRDLVHGWFSKVSAWQALVAGAPGFFAPRLPPPWALPPGSLESTSFYDTSALKSTLERLVDFDRINAGEMLFSVGAVNVQTGNFVYFDTATHKIRPEHILASAALPPGFPAIEIDGEYYWDGGLVSNTPLQWVVETEQRHDMLAFQVDLWSSRGLFPCDMTEVAIRQKEIQYSSRTRVNTDRIKQLQKIRATLDKFLRDAPLDLRETEGGRLLSAFADPKVCNIVQLVYRSKLYEGNSKDYEFSRLSMTDHWRAGYDDAVGALQRDEIFERPDTGDGFRAFDFTFPESGQEPDDKVSPSRKAKL